VSLMSCLKLLTLTHMGATDIYLTASEACGRLRVSRETLRRLIASGEIEAYKAGPYLTSPYRIPEGAIADYLGRHRAGPAAGEAA